MTGVSRTALGVGVLRAMHRIVDGQPWVGDGAVSPRRARVAAAAV